MHGPRGWIVSLSSSFVHLGVCSQYSALVILPPCGHTNSGETRAPTQNEAASKVTRTKERNISATWLGRTRRDYTQEYELTCSFVEEFVICIPLYVLLRATLCKQDYNFRHNN